MLALPEMHTAGADPPGECAGEPCALFLALATLTARSLGLWGSIGSATLSGQWGQQPYKFVQTRTLGHRALDTGLVPSRQRDLSWVPRLLAVRNNW